MNNQHAPAASGPKTKRSSKPCESVGKRIESRRLVCPALWACSVTAMVATTSSCNSKQRTMMNGGPWPLINTSDSYSRRVMKIQNGQASNSQEHSQVQRSLVIITNCSKTIALTTLKRRARPILSTLEEVAQITEATYNGGKHQRKCSTVPKSLSCVRSKILIKRTRMKLISGLKLEKV